MNIYNNSLGVRVKPKSIAKNYMYTTLLNIVNMIFPLITFPYVARILSANGLGRVDFSISIVQYFVIISQLGIPAYAIRECAKYRDDKVYFKKTVQEILVINFFSVFLSLVLFSLTISSIKSLESYRSLFMLLSINIVMTNVGVEWFFHSLEEYKFITTRSIIVKFISALLIFILIKESKDVFLYVVINVLTVFLTNIINFIKMNKVVKIFDKTDDFEYKKHLLPIFLFFGSTIANVLYANLDKTMLGLSIGDKSVGLYTSANKMISVILPFITTLTVILLPRMSNYINNNLKDEVNALIKKTFNFVFILSIPVTLGLILNAKELIIIFAGYGYLESIRTAQVLSILLIIVALSNTIGSQVLVSHGKEKITFISVAIGTSANFVLNVIMIPEYKELGAAISSVISALTILTIQIYYSKDILRGNVDFLSILKYLVSSISILVICISIKWLHLNIILTLLLSVLASAVGYLGILILLKDFFVLEFLDKTKKMLDRKEKL